MALQGEGVQLGIGHFEGQDPDTFREADISAKLSGAGVSYRDLARSLNGRIEVIQGPGLSGNSGLGLIFGDFIGELINVINPFAKTETFTVNECAVAVVNIESGVARVEPLISQTEKMTIVAKGDIDLHTEKIQFEFNTKLRKGIGLSVSMMVNPFVSITGNLGAPVVGLDPEAVAVKGTIAVATVGLSLLAKSLSDRMLSSKDPCGDAIKKSREQLQTSIEKGNGGQ
jgi:AsmA protein